jgi:TonB-dependent starch-binding outer membrane protein SusC
MRSPSLFVANYIASTLYSGGTGAYVEGENANSMWRFVYAGVYDGQPMIYGAGDDMYDFTGLDSR